MENDSEKLYDLIGNGISIVSQTVGAIALSNNAVETAQTAAEREKQLALIAAKKTKTSIIVGFSFAALFLLFLGIVIYSKKPKYFQVGQANQTYTLNGIHAPKVA